MSEIEERVRSLETSFATILGKFDGKVSHGNLWAAAAVVSAVLIASAGGLAWIVKEQRTLMVQEFKYAMQKSAEDQAKLIRKELNRMGVEVKAAILEVQENQLPIISNVATGRIVSDPYGKKLYVPKSETWGLGIEEALRRAIEQGDLQPIDPADLYLRENGGFKPLKFE